MHTYLLQKKTNFEGVMDHVKKELSSIRTGRATPALVEDIGVSAYDTTMELKGLASLSVTDAKTLIIEPWDKQLLSPIEKAIRDAGIGLSPVPDGAVIRIVLPPMTEENRKQLAKIVREKMEEARVALRSVREEIRQAIVEKEKKKEMGEDEKFTLLEELDVMTKEYNELISTMGEKKEEEIMTV